MKIFILSDYPSREKPTYYSFIKSRVEAIKGVCELSVIKVDINEKNRNVHEIIQEDGYRMILLKIKKSNLPRVRLFLYNSLVKKVFEQLIKEEQPDLIHVHFSSYYSWIVADTVRKLHIPFCITEHATFFEHRVNTFYFGRKIKMALQEADMVFAVSRSLRDTMLKYISRPIEVKHNIVNTAKFSLRDGKQHEEKQPKQALNILTVGSFELNDKKGYEILIKALAKLKEKGIPFQCKIIGEGPNKDNLLTLRDEHGITENVDFPGSVANDKLQEFYWEADFFVSSSRTETFGVVLIEAMSCGLPVVATRSGGPEDFVDDSVGLLVANESVDALCEGMLLMAARYRTYDSSIIRQTIENRFSADRYKEQMQGIYASLIDTNKKHRDYSLSLKHTYENR
ncbi:MULTISPECIES: glycosyltransferase [unclassified Paenibacillus]|uniref:glycosyltransferase n=1 Tax=unclassified Paenibacillus TaxID=185978 RepID=UPI00020D71E4|nr:MULTISPECIES: glycosyltransferase [unclassified Paenibacillus]EGL19336.1 glycosyltransferase, group 1 family protein [Paenibacillus sp. HGF7]EPD82528.1 hypothetical protein HMPREF1207_03320 [Paenibacillus sp. HGH0039]